MRDIWIFLHPIRKELHKNQIDDFIAPYLQKILPQFQDIGAEANEAAEQYFNEIMSTPTDEYIDGSDMAELAHEYGFRKYNMLRLGLYTATASWHATLFEFYHQQMRIFLYDEIRRYVHVEFSSFIDKYNDITNLYRDFGFDFESLNDWPILDELRLLCNVIKHGHGRSEQELRERNGSLFVNADDTDLMNLYRTTLLEETLNINSESLFSYASAIKRVWEDVPEQLSYQYSSD